MPANPSHEGLTAQGWNWSLSDAKSYVAKYGALNIGQTYITSDGKTRLYIHLEDGRLSPELNLKFLEAGSFTVDWGDGTALDTVSGDSYALGTVAHTYAIAGDYVISIAIVSGSLSIVGDNGHSSGYSSLLKKVSFNHVWENKAYNSCIRKIEIGNKITSIESCAFDGCNTFTSITIPNSVTLIESDAFMGCYALLSITIPDSVTSIGTRAFGSCVSLASVIIPDSVTTIGAQAFQYCSALTSVIIPDSVTTIDSSAFRCCFSLASITIPDSVTAIRDYTFESCNSLTSITIPDSVTTIDYNAFRDCVSLTSITIPDNVTSIGQDAFGSCASLTSVIISNSVTTIKTDAFERCYGIGYLKFESATPPTLSVDAFSDLLTDCIIYVPEGTLEAYTTATNYPNPSQYTYQEYSI